MTLGEIIKQYRDEHGLSQRQFADICGDMTNGYISMIEQGYNPSTKKPIIPSIDKVASFARAMGMSLHQLCKIADDMPVFVGNEEEQKPVAKQKHSKKWIMLSEGFEEFEKKKNDEFEMVFNMLSKSYPEFFGERNDDDDPRS